MTDPMPGPMPGPMPDPVSGRSWLRRLLTTTAQARVVSGDSRYGRPIALVGGLLVLVGCVVSVRSLGVGLGEIRLVPLGALVVVSVGLVVLNAVEYGLTSQVSGGRVPFRSALHVTVLASAANVLPLPAGAMVRIQGLRESGVSTRRAATASVAVALAWLSTAGVFAGGAVGLRGRWPTAAAVMAVSVLALGAAVKLLLGHGASAAVVRSVLLTEIGFVANAAVRFHLVLLVIDVDVAATQSVVLAASSSLASAVGIVPGAFGIAEGLAAVLAAAVDLPASAGFLATALLRLTSVVIVGLFALALAAKHPPAEDAVQASGSGSAT